jgi:EAL domain-containing protein (putative c-di-GMP-specific phosphodiesterase class I)
MEPPAYFASARCDVVQGFLVGVPVPAEDLTSSLDQVVLLSV